MKSNFKWVLITIVLTFFLALIFGGISNILVERMNIYIAIVVLLVIVILGILFDMIGISIATCEEAPFHARAAKKLWGAKESLKILKEKEKNTNICNDLLGDICGIISGSIGALIAYKIAVVSNLNIVTISLFLGAIIASITVGGKAMGKSIGINNREKILEYVGKTIYIATPIKFKK